MLRCTYQSWNDYCSSATLGSIIWHFDWCSRNILELWYGFECLPKKFFYFCPRLRLFKLFITPGSTAKVKLYLSNTYLLIPNNIRLTGSRFLRITSHLITENIRKDLRLSPDYHSLQVIAKLTWPWQGGQHSTEVAFALLTQLSRVRFLCQLVKNRTRSFSENLPF